MKCYFWMLNGQRVENNRLRLLGSTHGTLCNSTKGMGNQFVLKFTILTYKLILDSISKHALQCMRHASSSVCCDLRGRRSFFLLQAGPAVPVLKSLYGNEPASQRDYGHDAINGCTSYLLSFSFCLLPPSLTFHVSLMSVFPVVSLPLPVSLPLNLSNSVCLTPPLCVCVGGEECVCVCVPFSRFRRLSL